MTTATITLLLAAALTAFADVPAPTVSKSDWSIPRLAGESAVDYFHREFEFTNSVYAALREGKPLPAGALPPHQVEALNRALFLADHGLDADTVTEAELADLRQTTQRRAIAARDARWKVLQEPGLFYPIKSIAHFVDGDTIDVAVDLESDGFFEIERIRLYAVDVIERGHPRGKEATEQLHYLVATGGPWTLWVPSKETRWGTTPERGKYGRLLGVLYLGEGETADELYQLTCVNEEIAKRYAK